MEKFSKWNDPGSGVNPFIPPSYRLPRAPRQRALDIAGGLALVAVRLPFLLTAAAMIVLVRLFLHPLVFGAVLCVVAKKLGREWWAFVVVPGLVFSLLLLRVKAVERALVGVWYELLFVTLGITIIEKKKDIRGLKPAGPSSFFWSSVEAGDILVCNHTSFMEVLYLSWKTDCLFAAVGVKPGALKAAAAKRIGFLASIYRATTVPPLVIDKGGEPLADIMRAAKDAGRPVAIFPEVVRSNGEGVLEWQPGLFQGMEKAMQASPPPVHLVSFSYLSTQRGVSAASPVRSLLGTLFWLMYGNEQSVMTVAVMSKGDLPPMEKGSESLRSFIAGMGGCRTVSCGYNDYVSFVKYWRLVQAGKKKEAAAIADKRKKA